MKVKVVFLLCAIFLLAFGNVYAANTSVQSPPLTKLDDVADEALQMTKLGRYDEAKQLLDYFSSIFTSETIKARQFSMDELRVLTLSHDSALRSVTSMQSSPEDKLNKVTTFRLVTDALNSRYQPLWTDMESPVMSAFDEAKAAAKKGDIEAYYFRLNQFLVQYNIIEPSLKVDIPFETVQRLDAEVNYLDNYRTSEGTDRQLKQMNQLGTDLKDVFNQMSQDQTDPSLWWVIFTTGGIIILTLSYVGWRKYLGQKLDRHQKNRND
ncbi:sporulation protein YpjB [Heyndrickxia acidicola]|uniref:Sporulation protein YpjB n=1 Tax=Heyndrickxia acidicola TaxID=209389 RepID=A0ABU6MKF8_9BACI|nr:sporulation protein YpjB [Heyndrickxia acidicola]MED1205010.1 sporulation protein YpjB [Heyndrickxia acidicola]